MHGLLHLVQQGEDSAGQCSNHHIALVRFSVAIKGLKVSCILSCNIPMKLFVFGSWGLAHSPTWELSPSVLRGCRFAACRGEGTLWLEGEWEREERTLTATFKRPTSMLRLILVEIYVIYCNATNHYLLQYCRWARLSSGMGGVHPWKTPYFDVIIGVNVFC